MGLYVLDCLELADFLWHGLPACLYWHSRAVTQLSMYMKLKSIDVNVEFSQMV